MRWQKLQATKRATLQGKFTGLGVVWTPRDLSQQFHVGFLLEHYCILLPTAKSGQINWVFAEKYFINPAWLRLTAYWAVQ